MMPEIGTLLMGFGMMMILTVTTYTVNNLFRMILAAMGTMVGIPLLEILRKGVFG